MLAQADICAEEARSVVMKMQFEIVHVITASQDRRG